MLMVQKEVLISMSLSTAVITAHLWESFPFLVALDKFQYVYLQTINLPILSLLIHHRLLIFTLEMLASITSMISYLLHIQQ